MQDTEIPNRGRDAFERGHWPDAYDQLRRADAVTTLEPTDLERLATSAYLTGHDAESAEAWRRAHRAWQQQGELRRAVRCAFWLGLGLVQRGEMAQGGGWLARAGRLVEDHELDTVERGYLSIPPGLKALGEGEPNAALERFGAVLSVAQRFRDPDLAALGVLGRGQALLRLGRTTEGLRLFDEAMVSVTSGETTPMVSGLVYCAVIDECRRAFDIGRAREWTAALDRWCDQQPGLVPYRGQCLVHRSQVLQVGGEWNAATVEVERARRWLSDPPNPAVGMAHYQRGELHRMRGEFEEAEGAYRQAHLAGHDLQPGLALLRLTQGATGTAASAIEAALEAASDPVGRTRLLPAYAGIMLAAGRRDEAAAAADELDALADGSPTMLGAIAAQTRGALFVADGEPAAALRSLREALDAWQQLRAPFEAAEVRVLLGVACQELDDADGAALEWAAARAVFLELGAAPALARLDRMSDARPGPAPRRNRAGGMVTQRELEVLRLVAAGRTNREIAQELALSVKTVERHLGNIFTKLGVPNRAAATAHAYAEGMI